MVLIVRSSALSIARYFEEMGTACDDIRDGGRDIFACPRLFVG
jgi:hypothetical protein